MHNGGVIAGFLASCAVAAFAFLRGALSPSGALAAVAVGTSIWAGGGGRWFAALMTFFVTSTLLGRVGRAAKEATKREFSKGDRRDALQVLANGGVAALAAGAAAAWGGSPALTAVFVGALATANGDTWATELGVLSRREPFSLVTLRRVPRGTSGAVSPLGLLATLLGALAVALPLGSLRLALVAGVAGTCGSLADSLLGATVQTRFRCPACDKLTEGARHHCGAVCAPAGGFIGNDAVNFLATAVGALVAYGLT
jgi:uncharacterized protein (TIGR00297 family)